MQLGVAVPVAESGTAVGIAGADSPWRTTSTVVAPGGGVNRCWRMPSGGISGSVGGSVAVTSVKLAPGRFRS